MSSARRRRRRRQGAEVVIFRFMYKCFSRGLGCAQGCAAVPRGEDAYRKVSRRIEKCSPGFRAGDDGAAGWINRGEKAAPYIRETTAGERQRSRTIHIRICSSTRVCACGNCGGVLSPDARRNKEKHESRVMIVFSRSVCPFFFNFHD